MARHSSTYRGARRNACLKEGVRSTWPWGGMQLDPGDYTPVNFYKTKRSETTKEMFAEGLHHVRRLLRLDQRKGK